MSVATHTRKYPPLGVAAGIRASICLGAQNGMIVRHEVARVE